MIESGSHVPGIDWESIGVPAGTAIRYERPAAPLAPFFANYAVLDSDRSVFKGPESWLLPGWAKIWIVLTDSPIKMQVRNRTYDPLGVAMLNGPTSRAIPVTSNGGVSIVVDVTPLGWARWFDIPADAYRDRITPLQQIWPEETVDVLIACLHASDRGAQVKPLLDDFFLARLPAPKPREDRIVRATALLADPAITDIDAVAAALGISAQTLLRLCRAHFGYGPKQLMRRTRFLRALTRMMVADDPDFSKPPLGYYDLPHFLRDGRDFLGMTPRRFLAIPMPYLRAALRAREQIIGARWSVLDPVADSVA